MADYENFKHELKLSQSRSAFGRLPKQVRAVQSSLFVAKREIESQVFKKIQADELSNGALELALEYNQDALSHINTLEDAILVLDKVLKLPRSIYIGPENKLSRARLLSIAAQDAWRAAKQNEPKAVGPTAPLTIFTAALLGHLGLQRSLSTVSEELRKRSGRPRNGGRKPAPNNPLFNQTP